MSPEAEAAKERVLMDYPSALVSEHILQAYFYCFASETRSAKILGGGIDYETAWLATDLENNRRIVLEKWPDAYCKKTDGIDVFTVRTSRQRYALDTQGLSEHEAWLNARKMVRGES